MPAVELTEKQKKYLRGRAHALDPVIRVGHGGLSPGVVAETARALSDHELIKVKVQSADRDSRNALVAELAARTASVLVHRIGHVAVLYRPHPQLPRIVIPDD